MLNAKRVALTCIAVAPATLLVLDQAGVVHLTDSNRPQQRERRLSEYLEVPEPETRLDSLFGSIRDGFSNAWGHLVGQSDRVGDHWDTVSGHASNAADRFGDHLGNAADTMGDHWDTVSGHASNAAGRVGDHMGNAADRLGDHMGNAADRFGNHMDRFGNHMNNAAGRMSNGFDNAGGRLNRAHDTWRDYQYSSFENHLFKVVVLITQAIFAFIYYFTVVSNYPYWNGPTPMSCELQQEFAPCATCNTSPSNCCLSWCCPQARAAHTFDRTGTLEYWCGLLGMFLCPWCTLCYTNACTDLNPKLGSQQANPIASAVCAWACSCCVIAQDAESLDAATGCRTTPCSVEAGMMPYGGMGGYPMAGPMNPGMMQPGMMQPGMMQPGMMQPGMMQPGW